MSIAAVIAAAYIIPIQHNGRRCRHALHDPRTEQNTPEAAKGLCGSFPEKEMLLTAAD
ncbi:hypothetical protein [Cohnella sp. AR92]|uniref:hypothetical protein n=1 Tax=Cohnella sp. AR92 TaxID=648716 RepID=UPI001315AA19|nr:hypothetical protein [Cohnella sp. AR92]